MIKISYIKEKKSSLHNKSNRITHKSARVIHDFAGKYKSRALKNKTPDEIIEIENDAIIKGNIEKFTKN